MPSNASYPTPSGAAAPVSGLASAVGQTILVVGIISGLDLSSYYTPFPISSIASAATLFGTGETVRVIAEIQRQGAPAINAIVLQDESELPSLFDYLTDVAFDILVPVRLAATRARGLLFGNFAYLREQTGQAISIVMPAVPHGLGGGTLLGPSLIDPTVILDRYFVRTLDMLTINPNVPSQYTADAAPSVAGVMARSLPSVAITNKTLYGVRALGATYADVQALPLANTGFTTLRQTIRHGLVPYLGITATSVTPGDLNYSPSFHKLSTLRTCQYVVTLIQNATRWLIGGTATMQVQGIVSRLLAGLQRSGVILAYDSTITIAQVAGAITMSLNLLPPYETTMQTVSTSVTTLGTS